MTDRETDRDTQRPGQPSEVDTAKDPLWRRVVSNVAPILVALAIVLPLRSSVADWNDVPTGSMRPTIIEGDRVTVNKLAYGLRVPFTHYWVAQWGAPSRGEIVTLASPADGIRLVKRIVGIPGDRVEMHENRLIVNGQPVDYERVSEGKLVEAWEASGSPGPVIIARELLPGRAHAVAFRPTRPGPHSFAERVVPEGHYFFMGDNRDESKDSRLIGVAERDAIYGRASYVALSVDPLRGYRPRFERFGTRLQ